MTYKLNCILRISRLQMLPLPKRSIPTDVEWIVIGFLSPLDLYSQLTEVVLMHELKLHLPTDLGKIVSKFVQEPGMFYCRVDTKLKYFKQKPEGKSQPTFYGADILLAEVTPEEKKFFGRDEIKDFRIGFAEALKSRDANFTRYLIHLRGTVQIQDWKMRVENCKPDTLQKRILDMMAAATSTEDLIGTKFPSWAVPDYTNTSKVKELMKRKLLGRIGEYGVGIRVNSDDYIELALERQNHYLKTLIEVVPDITDMKLIEFMKVVHTGNLEAARLLINDKRYKELVENSERTRSVPEFYINPTKRVLEGTKYYSGFATRFPETSTKWEEYQ